MSEGKFSQPRPYRDEERQIEESFRLLTEEKNRHRKKTYNVEEDIQKTVQEISAQEVSLPEETVLPFERSVIRFLYRNNRQRSPLQFLQDVRPASGDNMHRTLHSFRRYTRLLHRSLSQVWV